MRLIAILLVITSPLTLNGQFQLDDALSGEGFTYSELVSRIEGSIDTTSAPQFQKDIKHFRRWQFAMEPHIGSDGKLTNFALKNWNAARKSELMNNSSQRGTTHGDWDDITPVTSSVGHPNHGRINTIAVHPTNPNTIFVGGAVGGLWVTYNDGATWANLTDGLPVIGISDILIHPTTPSIMYILTGDGNARHIPSIGVLKSVDGGYTWQTTGYLTDPDDLFYGYKMIMDPNDPNTMFIAGTAGIRRTTDGWNTSSLVRSGVSMRDIEFKPGSSDTIYGSSRFTVLQSVTGGGFGSWTDLGPLSIGLPDTTAMSRVALAVTEDAPDYIFALYAYDVPGGGNGYQGLFVSDDNGASWTMNSDTLNVVGAGDRNQVWYDLALGVSPSDFQHVLVGGVYVHKSENTGITDSWSNVHSGMHDDVHDFQYAGSKIYAACDGGIGKSTDGGLSWINISDGLNLMQYYDIDVLGDKIIGGTQDNGTNYWELGDFEAIRVISSDGFESIFDPSNPNIVYGCTQNRRLKSTNINTGANFSDIHPPGHGAPWDASWVMHPTDFDTMYCSFVKIARTYDAGATWDTLAQPPFTTPGVVRAIAQGVNNPDVMYVSNRSQLFKTSNIHAATPTWVDLTPFVPAATAAGIFPGTLQLGGIAVDPEDANKVWITFRNYTDTSKVYYNATGGANDNWVNLSGILPNVPVYTIAAQPGSGDGLYIATDLGVFFRRAIFSDWIYFSNGLPNTRVEDLKILDGYLYAGTFGRGVWRSPLYFTCPGTISLGQSSYAIGMHVYSAFYSIQSSQLITGGVGTDVTYTASEDITLIPGFHAKSLSTFEVKIGGCPN